MCGKSHDLIWELPYIVIAVAGIKLELDALIIGMRIVRELC
jgi:hypothetical protein